MQHALCNLKYAIIISLLLPAAAFAEYTPLERPHWSLELKGGTFSPSLPDWEKFYGRKNMPEYALSLAYKFTRRIETGIEIGTARTTGTAAAPLHDVLAGEVKYRIVPVNAFFVYRGSFGEDQWLVPYAGGGFTKILYWETVESQGGVKGSANGYHARGGLQFLLDGLDRRAANSMYMDYGINHTYLFVEAEYTSAKVKGVSADLGGTAYRAGLLFEF
jgi:hypothetical protein